eukprot:TRINITY_DN4951_c0_g1_i1.p2 TRINITY_DN4951_c0_g1~~TRINITY_DN4951_c0_g1_i1.p2  ORF type:complete len:135 (+),score=29.38 TRINITY_DN4951_c0_g1_i1:638-1042(+)
MSEDYDYDEDLDDPIPDNLLEAFILVLKKARIHNGIVRGLNQTVRALEKRVVLLCVIAEDCEEEAYITLIDKLAQETTVDIVRVPEKKKLGEWVGLAKYDQHGNIKKVISTSSIAIVDYGEKSIALEMLLQHFA